MCPKEWKCSYRHDVGVVIEMKRLIVAFLLLSSVAWAGGPDVQAPSAEDLNASVSSITTTLAGKAPILSPVFSGNASFPGFVNIGAGSPKIKMKKITGNTPSSEDSDVNLAHGVSGSAKILMVDVKVTLPAAPQYMILSGSPISGRSFYYYLDDANVIVHLNAANSSQIVSASVTATIVYEE